MTQRSNENWFKINAGSYCGVVMKEKTARRMRTVFESLGDAAEAVGGYKSNISRACEEKKIYKGFAWERG